VRISFTLTTLYLYWAALCWFLAITAAFLYALRRGRDDLAAMALPALVMLAFYALLSDFIVRHAVPALPAALLVRLLTAQNRWLRRPENIKTVKRVVDAHPGE
jgi:hypothetical protein